MQVVQWFKNGDHPDDQCQEMTDGDGRPFLTEGKVVRRFRHPSLSGVSHCPVCKTTFDHHGWLDTGGDGQVVCPGDSIYTLKDGRHVAVPKHLLSELDREGLTVVFTQPEA